MGCHEDEGNDEREEEPRLLVRLDGEEESRNDKGGDKYCEESWSATVESLDKKKNQPRRQIRS